MQNGQLPSGFRNGFTLLEVMVVLGLMTLIAAIAFPAVQNRLARSEVESAAEQLKIELAQTRLNAIETGVAQKFRYQPGSNLYELSPCPEGVLSLYVDPEDQLDSDFDLVDDSDEEAFAFEGELAEETGLEEEEEEVLQSELPDGILFASQRPETEETDVAAPVVSEEEAEVSTDGEGWSRPILFFPNGRSTGAEIFLTCKPNLTVPLQLRGLTGTAEVGDTLRSKQESTEESDFDSEAEETSAEEPELESEE